MSIQISWYLRGLCQRIGLGGLRVVVGRGVCLPLVGLAVYRYDIEGGLGCPYSREFKEEDIPS
jgi:hypothetical protein